MRHLFKTLAALVAAAAAMTACQTAPVETVKESMVRAPKTIQFSAGSPDTRTAFTTPDDNNYPVVWTENDSEVVVLPEDFSLWQKASLERSSDGKTAKFDLAFTLPETDSYRFHMLSPASAFKDVATGQSVSLTVPDIQTPTPLSVDEAAMLLAASSDSYTELPDRVVFSPEHLTAYIKLTLSGVDADAVGSVGSVSVESTVPLAGDASYDYETKTLTPATDAGKTVTAVTESTTDVWFACLPAQIGGETLTITLSGNKGSLIREVEIPSDRNLQPGHIALITVNMASATPPAEDKVFSRISEARFVAEGTQFVMATAADDLSYGLSATQGSDFRLGVPVTKSRPGTKAGEGAETIVNPSDDVEILTVEAGTTAINTDNTAWRGPVALKTKAGKYLAVDINKSVALLSVDTKSALTDWIVKYDANGVCEIRNKDASSQYTYYLRYRKSDNKFLAVRPSFVDKNEPIALYALEGSAGSNTKIKPSLRLNKTSLTITKGNTQRLTVAVCYSLDDGGVVTFRSDDTSIATVSDKGDVTAVNTGETYIWAHVGETENYQADSVSCKVTVQPPVPVKGISVSPENLALFVGETQKISLIVNPSNAYYTNVNWAVSSDTDKQYVSVDQHGNVTALKSSDHAITITVSVRDADDKDWVASCQVTTAEPFAINSFALSPDELSLKPGESQSVSLVVDPADAQILETTYASENEAVATFKNGVVKAVGPGSTSVSATILTKDGRHWTASCSVTVSDPLESISLDKTELAMAPDGTYTLTATVVPEGSEITWSSSDPSVASVNDLGKVTAHKVGSATITVASTYDSSKSASCAVTVDKTPVLKLQFAQSMVSTAWTDYTSPKKLGYSGQQYVLRLYDVANDRVVKEGEFGVEGGTCDPNTKPEEYEIKPYLYVWELILRNRDGYFGATVTYVNEAQGVYFSQDVMFYVDRYLEMTLNIDCSDIRPIPIVVNKTGPVRLYFRHEKDTQLELVESQYLTITKSYGDAGVAELVKPDGSGYFLTINPKKVGSVVYDLSYHHPLGSQFKFSTYQVSIEVQDLYAIRTSGSTGSGTEVTSFEYTYDDRSDNLNFFKLYDNVNKTYVTSASDLSVSTDDSNGFITAYINGYGEIVVKAAKRSMKDRSAQITVYHKGEKAATFEYTVKAPEYLLFFSKTTSFDFSNYLTLWTESERTPLALEEPIYFAVYDKNHYKVVKDNLSFAISARLCNGSTNWRLNNKYFDTERIRPNGYDIFKVSPKAGSAVRLYISVGTDAEGTKPLQLGGGRVYIAAKDKIVFSSDYPSIGLSYTNWPNVKDREYFFLWNSKYQWVDLCYFFDPAYMTWTSSNPDVIKADKGYYQYHGSSSEWVSYFGYYVQKSGSAVLTVNYDDGFGNTYSSDYHLTAR